MSAASRGGLEDTPFGYRHFKDGQVVISWRGRQATILKGRKAAAFLTQVEDLDQAIDHHRIRHRLRMYPGPCSTSTRREF